MSFIDYCTEGEEQNGCMGTGGFRSSVVHPRDGAADGEVRLSALLAPRERHTAYC